MDCQSIIIKRLKQHSNTIELISSDTNLLNAINNAVNEIVKCFAGGHRVYFCGNGGSAADAQHLAAEFSGRFYIDRGVLPSEALHCNSSYMTAVANDYSFDMVYSRLISGIGSCGDILVGISTSGNSANIVKAFEACRTIGIKTIAMTGNSGGKMKDLSDILINVPSVDTPRIQEGHITIGHIICELVEKAIFTDK